jgi:hypothetical protein
LYYPTGVVESQVNQQEEKNYSILNMNESQETFVLCKVTKVQKKKKEKRMASVL